MQRLDEAAARKAQRRPWSAPTESEKKREDPFAADFQQYGFVQSFGGVELLLPKAGAPLA
jgi:hypothetical protein